MSEHFCHAKACKVIVSPNMLMCKEHWYMVSADLRKAVWREYRPGQEVDKEPTAEYLKTAQKAITAVQAREERQGSTGRTRRTEKK
jgi:hypothetical protein